jgi:hypothetical protein
MPKPAVVTPRRSKVAAVARLNLKAQAVDVQALSVVGFCRAHDISRALFYLLLKRGGGPRVMRVGGRTLVSTKAAAEWRDAMEAGAK